MNWKSKAALFFWKLILPIALFSSGLLLVLIFPEKYIGDISLTTFSLNSYLLLFGAVVVFAVIFFFMFYVFSVAWVILFRKFIGGESTLNVIRNACKVKSPARNVFEYIFMKTENNT